MLDGPANAPRQAKWEVQGRRKRFDGDRSAPAHLRRLYELGRAPIDAPRRLGRGGGPTQTTRLVGPDTRRTRSPSASTGLPRATRDSGSITWPPWPTSPSITPANRESSTYLHATPRYGTCAESQVPHLLSVRSKVWYLLSEAKYGTCTRKQSMVLGEGWTYLNLLHHGHLGWVPDLCSRRAAVIYYMYAR